MAVMWGAPALVMILLVQSLPSHASTSRHRRLYPRGPRAVSTRSLRPGDNFVNHRYWTSDTASNFLPDKNPSSRNVNVNHSALRKITFYENDRYRGYKSSKSIPPPRKPTEFVNFVTPRLRDGYEVTTEMFNDSDPETALPLGTVADNDVPIAIDDGEGSRINPLVYVDSYGRVRQSQGHKYGVAHLSHPSGYQHPNKGTGRVRMQVFRGPTRTWGRKKYAQWGYYVVQPAADSPHRPQHH